MRVNPVAADYPAGTSLRSPSGAGLLADPYSRGGAAAPPATFRRPPGQCGARGLR
jgi:hypothetical protein